jgi:hypothetical protein
MSPDELKVRARRIPEELLTQGDLAVADELIAPDCQHHAPHPVGPDGTFAEHWSSWDLLGLLRQLGAVPPGAAETPFSNRAESPGARCPVSASENA